MIKTPDYSEFSSGKEVMENLISMDTNTTCLTVQIFTIMEQPIHKSYATRIRARNSEIETTEMVIVTGSIGLTGTQIIKKLAKKSRTIGPDRLVDPYPPVAPHFICFDIASEESIRAAITRVGYGFGDEGFSIPIAHQAAGHDEPYRSLAKELLHWEPQHILRTRPQNRT